MPGGWCREIRDLTGEPDCSEVLLKNIARFRVNSTDLENLSAHPVIMPRGDSPISTTSGLNRGADDRKKSRTKSGFLNMKQFKSKRAPRFFALRPRAIPRMSGPKSFQRFELLQIPRLLRVWPSPSSGACPAGQQLRPSLDQKLPDRTGLLGCGKVCFGCAIARRRFRREGLKLIGTMLAPASNEAQVDSLFIRFPPE